MKKLLALVLALVMTLGLATVSAGASYDPGYKDKSEIDFSEAANVLSAVGVFQGKGENFAPKDNLNRAEAAKLVAYLMLGNKTAEAMKGNGNKFTDVPADHWAAGYIEYLASAGIVSGVGGGKFDPNGQVTAVQFAKMLDVALGYDAEIEGFVGDSWNINIMKKANDNDLFDLLKDLGSNDVLTREQAAQMCLNALQADTYEYESKGTTVSLNGAQVVVDAKKATRKLSKTSYDNIKSGDLYMQLGEELYKGDLKRTTGGHDDYGRPSTKWTYKTEDVGTYATKKDLVETLTDKVTMGKLYDIVGKTTHDNISDTLNGKSPTTRGEFYFYEDGKPVTVDKTNFAQFMLKNGSKATNNDTSTGNGTVTEVYVDDDNNKDVVTVVVINTYLVKITSDYRASTEDVVFESKYKTSSDSLLLDKTRLELEDFPEIKDLKKDDYVLVSGYYNSNGRYEIKNIDKAEVLTGKVDKVVVSDSVTIDGETLKYSKKVDSDSKAETYSVGDEATVVLDKYGYIIYVDEAVVANNYVFISEFFSNGSSTSKVRANAYFTDGTTSEITVKEVYVLHPDTTEHKLTTKTELADKKADSGLAATTVVAGKLLNQKFAGWYAYSKNSSNEYTLSQPKKSYTKAAQSLARNSGTTDYELKGDSVSFINNSTGGAGIGSYADQSSKYDLTTGASAPTVFRANDKTIMIVTYKEKNDVDVYTGVKNLPDIKMGTSGSAAYVFEVMDGNYAKYVFVTLTNATVYGSENQNMLYVLKYDKENKTSDNKTYYTYTALDENANKITIEAANDSVFSSVGSAGDNVYTAFYKASKDSDGRYTHAEVGTGGKYWNSGSISPIIDGRTYPIDSNNGTLTLGNQSFTLANNYKLVVVTLGGLNGAKADALNKNKGEDYEANIMSADNLEAILQQYQYSYTYQVKVDENGGHKLVEAYVTINDAVPSNKTSTLRVSSLPAGVTISSISGATTTSTDLVYTMTNDTVTITLSGNAVGSSVSNATVTGSGKVWTVTRDNRKIDSTVLFS